MGNVKCSFSGSDVESLDALVVEDDLATERLVTIEDGAFSAASNA